MSISKGHKEEASAQSLYRFAPIRAVLQIFFFLVPLAVSAVLWIAYVLFPDVYLATASRIAGATANVVGLLAQPESGRSGLIPAEQLVVDNLVIAIDCLLIPIFIVLSISTMFAYRKKITAWTRYYFEKSPEQYFREARFRWLAAIFMSVVILGDLMLGGVSLKLFEHHYGGEILSIPAVLLRVGLYFSMIIACLTAALHFSLSRLLARD